MDQEAEIILLDVVQKKKERTLCNLRLPVEVATLLLPTLLTLTSKIGFPRTYLFFNPLVNVNLFLEQDPLLIVNGSETLILVDQGLQQEEVIRLKYAKKVNVAVPKHSLSNFQLAVNSDTNIKYLNCWQILEKQKQIN